MGYGAFMTVRNTTEADVLLTVGDMNCMYDEGDEGSNLQVFNHVKLAPNGSVGPQYIEAKASGSCAFEESYFYINVSEPAGGNFKITESGNEYTGESDPSNRFLLAIENSQPQAKIVVLLLP